MNRRLFYAFEMVLWEHHPRIKELNLAVPTLTPENGIKSPKTGPVGLKLLERPNTNLRVVGWKPNEPPTKLERSVSPVNFQRKVNKPIFKASHTITAG